MALKITEIRSFAKNTKFTYKTVKEVYDLICTRVKKELIDIDMLSKHVKMMIDNNLETVNDLENYIDTKLAELEGKQKLTPEEAKDKVHQEMNDYVKNLSRIKLGYDKRTWKKIVFYEDLMKKKLSELIPKFVSEMAIKGLSEDDQEVVELFDLFEKNWKDWARKNVINKYPGSERSDKPLRHRILALFSDKVEQLISKNKQVNKD